MSSRLLQSHLDTIESQISSVIQLLDGSASADLVSACAALQSAVLDFSGVVKQKSTHLDADPSLKTRLGRVSMSLASCRENLARRAAFTQGALAALMPATRQDNYAPATNRYGRKP